MPLSKEFADLAGELARKHRVSTELVLALLELEGGLAIEADPTSEMAAARHVEAVLLGHPFEDTRIGQR